MTWRAISAGPYLQFDVSGDLDTERNHERDELDAALDDETREHHGIADWDAAVGRSEIHSEANLRRH
jgi:hypothetical protein